MGQRKCVASFPCNHRSCCQIGSAGKISSFKHPRTTKMRHIAYQYKFSQVLVGGCTFLLWKKEPVYEMEANDLPFFHLCASHFEFPCHRHSYFTLVWKEHPFVHILNSTLAKKLRNFFPFPLGTMRV